MPELSLLRDTFSYELLVARGPGSPEVVYVQGGCLGLSRTPKLSRMPTSKERGAKRLLRRNGSSARSGHSPHPATAGAAPCQNPQAGRQSNRNNKYFLLEERAREERRLRRIAEEAQEARSGRGGGPGWMLAATGTGGNSVDAISPLSPKRGESRMRMTRVDGFNSTAGPPPQKSNVWLPDGDGWQNSLGVQTYLWWRFAWTPFFWA